MTRFIGPRLIAVLLALYAMGGVLLASMMVVDRDPRFQWGALAAAAALFALVAGSAALTTWRIERRAPAWALASGICGAGLMTVIPLASELPPDAAHDVWRAAALGGVLFLIFMMVAAAYLRAWLRAFADRGEP